MSTGFFARWGKMPKDDALLAPCPELLDIEISTSCAQEDNLDSHYSSEGGCKGSCGFCYKSNKAHLPVYNMTLDEFKRILGKVNCNGQLTQAALGIMNTHTNPDFFKMMEYARSVGVIPNYTCHGIDTTMQDAERTAVTCGAVAVSVLPYKEKAYDAIKMFVDAGMTQCNCHFMLANESLDRAYQTVRDMKTDKRLGGMNAIVFLQYKDKGNGKGRYTSIRDVETYKKLIDFCNEKHVNYGFDSCSAPLFLKAIEGDEKAESLAMMSDCCEAACFSSYVSSTGMFYPCSFCEGEGEWVNGISVLECQDFMRDVWMHPRVMAWRSKLLGTTEKCKCKHAGSCRACPVFDIVGCKTV
jgi:hypothetical protein